MNRSLAESLSQSMIGAAHRWRLPGTRKRPSLPNFAGRAMRAMIPPRLHSAMGHLQFELRQFETAAHAYAEALRLEPFDATTIYNGAVCLEQLCQLGRCRGGFQQAVAADSAPMPAPGWALEFRNFTSATLKKRWTRSGNVWNASRFGEAALRGEAVALHLLGRNDEASEAYGNCCRGIPSPPSSCCRTQSRSPSAMEITTCSKSVRSV